MTDRLFSVLLLFVSLLYGLTAWRIQVPFAFDPLGPQPLPITLAILLFLLAGILILRPAQKNSTPTTRNLSLQFLTILLFYQIAWTFLGFLLSTTISVYFLTRLFKRSWMEGLMTALLLSVICYGLFNFVLEIPLPLGTFFSYSGG